MSTGIDFSSEVWTSKVPAALCDLQKNSVLPNMHTAFAKAVMKICQGVHEWAAVMLALVALFELTQCKFESDAEVQSQPYYNATAF